MTIPAIGRIVRYRLSAVDADAITQNRLVTGRPGNTVSEGDALPMIIVRVHAQEAKPDSYVNGRVILDGDGPDYWARTVKQGEIAGTFSWPQR